MGCLPSQVGWQPSEPPPGFAALCCAVLCAVLLCAVLVCPHGSLRHADVLHLPSGVAGLVYIVIPNVMGIAVYSPPLDSVGNSVRAVTFFTHLMQVSASEHAAALHCGTAICVPPCVVCVAPPPVPSPLHRCHPSSCCQVYPCGIFDAMVRPDIQLFHRVDEFGGDEYDEPGRHDRGASSWRCPRVSLGVGARVAWVGGSCLADAGVKAAAIRRGHGAGVTPSLPRRDPLCSQ